MSKGRGELGGDHRTGRDENDMLEVPRGAAPPGPALVPGLPDRRATRPPRGRTRGTRAPVPGRYTDAADHRRFRPQFAGRYPRDSGPDAGGGKPGRHPGV
jgi:hypothetical protein